MYESYFKLKGKPFQLMPDPYFFFASSGHNRALAYVRYGLSQGEGFIVLSGEIGAGKSTLVRTLFASLENKKDIVAAELMNTQLDSTDILKMTAAAFGLAYQNSDKTVLLKNLQTFFVSRQREGKRCLLVIDEAQNLPLESIEELRMLADLQSNGKNLLQIILLGQPEFTQRLQTPRLEQMRQRITASYHLTHMNQEETRAYIEHRLKKVGWKDDPKFTGKAFDQIYEITDGIPRRINSLCDRLMLFAFLEEKHSIDEKVVKNVAEELRNEGLNGYASGVPATDQGKDGKTAKANGNASAPATATGRAAEPVASGALEQRMAHLEQEFAEMKKRFAKEHDYMRKVVALSLDFGKDD